MTRRRARGARRASLLTVGSVWLAGCTPGTLDSHTLLWAPFVVAVALGLVAAAAIIALGFGRPNSTAVRLGYLLLALGAWVALALAGLLFVLVTNPVY